MLDKRYLKQVYVSFKSSGGFIIGTIGGISSILSFIFKDDLGINPYLVICGTIILMVIISLIDVSLYFYNETLNNTPEVYKVIIRGDSTLLLTAYSDYLQIQGLVTVFWFNDGFEEFVGFGEVINIQNDKKIQIELRKIVDGMNNLEEKRKALIIKPFVTTKTIEE